MKKMWKRKGDYAIIFPLPPPILAQKGGVSNMDIITSLIAPVLAGVICHLICKWLDGDE